MKNLFTRNTAAIFIFIFVMLFVAQAQAARYGGSSTSTSSKGSSTPAYKAPSPSQKSVSFGSTNSSSSVTIKQPTSSNSMTNMYKRDMAVTPPAAAPLKTPAAQTIQTPTQQNTVYTPRTAQNSTVNAAPVQATQNSTPTKTVIIKEKTTVVDRRPQVQYSDNTVNTLLLINAMNASERAAYYQNRDSEEYRTWRRRAEMEARDNADLRAQLAASDREAVQYQQTTAPVQTQYKQQTAFPEAAAPANQPVKQTTSGWTWFVFIVGSAIGVAGCVFGYKILKGRGVI